MKRNLTDNRRCAIWLAIVMMAALFAFPAEVSAAGIPGVKAAVAGSGSVILRRKVPAERLPVMKTGTETVKETVTARAE